MNKTEPTLVTLFPPGSDDWRIALTELSRTLLTLLQQYHSQLEEIQSAKFLEDIEEFKETFPESESPLALDRSRRSFDEKAVQFIKKEKSYLEDREAERSQAGYIGRPISPTVPRVPRRC